MLVTVKTNKYCLEIHMSPDAPFAQILEELHSKFLDSAKFFGKAKMALAIFGQTLTYEQTAQILSLIHISAVQRIFPFSLQAEWF